MNFYLSCFHKKSESNHKRRFSGFTLAETLTTLLIIGIVAAITIPVLIHSYQDRVLTTKFRKAYAQLSHAWELAVLDGAGAYSGQGGWRCTWPDGKTEDRNIADSRDDALLKNLKNLHRCGPTECWPNEFEYSATPDLYGFGARYIYDNVYKTPDEVCISFSGYGRDEVHLIIDINCKKGPNKFGEDIFSMLLGADGKIYFLTDSKVTTDDPVTNGHVCPYGNNIQGKIMNFRDRLH